MKFQNNIKIHNFRIDSVVVQQKSDYKRALDSGERVLTEIMGLAVIIDNGVVVQLAILVRTIIQSWHVHTTSTEKPILYGFSGKHNNQNKNHITTATRCIYRL